MLTYSNLANIYEVFGSNYPVKVIAYRVSFRGSGHTQTKYFSIRKLGRVQAISDALIFRDSIMEDRLPKTKRTTGVIGVSKRRSVNGNTISLAYVVSYVVGPSRIRGFKVFTYAYKRGNSDKFVTKNQGTSSVVDAELKAFRCSVYLNEHIQTAKKCGSLLQLLSDIDDGKYPNIKGWKTCAPENLLNRKI